MVSKTNSYEQQIKRIVIKLYKERDKELLAYLNRQNNMTECIRDTLTCQLIRSGMGGRFTHITSLQDLAPTVAALDAQDQIIVSITAQVKMNRDNQPEYKEYVIAHYERPKFGPT